MKSSITACVISSLAILSIAAVSSASTITPFVDHTPDSGRVDTYDAGFSFSANAAVVDELGYKVYSADSSNTDILADSHEVGLYLYTSATGTYTLVTDAVIAAGSAPDSNGFAWASIPAYPLIQGDTYYVIAVNGGDDWSNSTSLLNSSFGTPNTTNGAYNLYTYSSTLPTSTTEYAGGNAYGGGNIGYAVPEPAALSLVGVALLGLLRQRRLTSNTGNVRIL